MTTTTSTTGSGTDPLWQDLADALNALIAAGRFPHFHDLYGTRNNWQHQPYASTAVHPLARRRPLGGFRPVHPAVHRVQPGTDPQWRALRQHQA